MNLLPRLANACLLLGLVCTSTAQNLITNGSFESNTTNWTNSAAEGGTATFTVLTNDATEGTRSLRIAMTKTGTNPWSIQSIHTNTSVTQGQPYTLTFYAKAAANGTSLNVVIQNTEYLSQTFSLTTTWTKYEWNFTAVEASPQLKFQYPVVGTYYIDDVQMVSQNTTANLNITVLPATMYQTMVGFGGAMTWYCDLVTKSSKKNEMINLMIGDAGTDIVRFKNWYYPSGYPSVKTTTNMEESYFKGHFDATNELYTLVKQSNPNTEILLSSWSPPSAYKSNNAQNQGTLKKNNGTFMYTEMGQYYKDVLDNITFNPEYFSFQNEPGYINAGWATCEWRPTETTDFPGYDKGLDAVYNAIKSRTFIPKLIGPETENIGVAAWNSSLNTFRDMSTPIVNKSYLHAYSYHLYNFAGSPNNVSASTLNMIKNEFGTKPNFMTEFSSSNFDWLQTADAIHQTVVEANASAYIYWELMWDATSTSAMFKVDGSGNYTIGDHFYTLKHFAKYVSKGHKRVSVTGGNSNVKISGYLNPTGNQVTLVAINNSTANQNVNLSFGTNSASSTTGYRSTAGSFYQTLGTVNLAQQQVLPAKSLTTYVVNLATVITGVDEVDSEEINVNTYPNPFKNTIMAQMDGDFEYELFNVLGMSLERGVALHNQELGSDLPKGTYILKMRKGDRFKSVKIIKD